MSYPASGRMLLRAVSPERHILSPPTSRAMRKLVVAALVLAVAACAKKDAAPADSPAAAAPPPAPAALTNADLAGTWEGEGMPMNKDSGVVRFTMMNTASDTGWTMTFASGEKAKVSNVVIAGDSVTSTAGPFKSQVRKGLTANVNSTFRVKDGKLVGVTHSKYSNGDTASFRITATKKP